jgi:hypothetical protein
MPTSRTRFNSTFKKTRDNRPLFDGQVVLYKGEVVQLFLEKYSKKCKIVLVKNIENDISETDNYIKKSGGLPIQTVRRINNELNELEIQELINKFYGDNQEPVNITDTRVFEKLIHTKGNTKQSMVVMNQDRNEELVQKLLKKTDAKIAESFQIEDNSWRIVPERIDMTDCQTSLECPVLFSDVNQQGLFARKKKEGKEKDSFTIYISIRVPKDELNVHVHSNECTYLRTVQIDGTCYLNAVINSFIMSLPLRQLIFEEEQIISETGMIHMTMEDMKKNHPVVPYSSDIVKKHFFSIIDHFKRKGRIVDNSSVINNLALQIKRNYYTIRDIYPFINLDGYEELSKTDNSPESGNSLLSLLEIIKTFTNINYEFVDVNDKNYIYSIHNFNINYLLLALGHIKLLKYDETAKKKHFVNLLPLNNDFLRKYNNTSEKASVGPLLRIKIEGQFPSYLSVSNGQRYIIQTAVMNILHTFESKKSGHSMTCYICNGVQYIHDPNNVILQINWIKNDSNNKEDTKDKLIEYFKNKYNTSIKNLDEGIIKVEIKYSIYLREDVLLKIERDMTSKNKNTSNTNYGNYESNSIRNKIKNKASLLIKGETNNESVNNDVSIISRDVKKKRKSKKSKTHVLENTNLP